ncbi:MAG TPA: hypothetical protein VIM42_00535 [Clostridium sp.]
MTFIFIVFRPYHIISAYNIIQMIKKKYPDAKCIGYISNAKDEFWDDLFDYDKIFDEKYYSFNLFFEKNILNVAKVVHNNIKINACINTIYENNRRIDGIITFSDTWKLYQKLVVKYKNVTNNCIVMDEGAALYYKNTVAESSPARKLIRKLLNGLDYESCSMGEHSKTLKVYANYPDKVKCTDKIIYQMPKLDYTKIIDVLKVKPEIINSSKKKCLFISTPTFILKNNDKTNSVDSTMKLFEILSENNIEIYFKMHPANETIDDIRIYLDKFREMKVIEDQSIPVELLCAANNFDYIISPISSALLNLSSFKFNCISLPYFATKFLQCHDLLELFKANGIKVALNEEELRSIIKRDETVDANEKIDDWSQQQSDDNSEFITSFIN